MCRIIQQGVIKIAAEKNFENKVKKFLESVGVYALGTPIQKMTTKPIGYYEKRWGNKMTSSGLPDMHIVIKGHSLEIELKAPNGKASELQKHMINQIQSSDCVGAVMYEHKKDIPIDGFRFYIHYEVFKETVMYYADKP